MYVSLKVTNDDGSGAENDPLSDIRLTAFVSDVPVSEFAHAHNLKCPSPPATIIRLTIKITNADEQAPVFVAATVADNSIDENSKSATDVDQPSSHTFTLPESETMLQITGGRQIQISLKSATLDHEAKDKDSHNAVVTVTATATDDSTPAQSAKATMKVLVADVNGDGHQDR